MSCLPISLTDFVGPEADISLVVDLYFEKSPEKDTLWRAIIERGIRLYYGDPCSPEIKRLVLLAFLEGAGKDPGAEYTLLQEIFFSLARGNVTITTEIITSASGVLEKRTIITRDLPYNY